MKSEAPRMHVKEQKLTFDRDILIQSIMKVRDAKKYVTNAFNPFCGRSSQRTLRRRSKSCRCLLAGRYTRQLVGGYGFGDYAACIAPPAATVITKSESSIDDNSLFTDDGFDRYMYSTGKASKVNRWFAI